MDVSNIATNVGLAVAAGYAGAIAGRTRQRVSKSFARGYTNPAGNRISETDKVAAMSDRKFFGLKPNVRARRGYKKRRYRKRRGAYRRRRKRSYRRRY